MEKRDETFIGKATKLLEEYKKLRNEYSDNDFTPQFLEASEPICNDMVHLLYSYDPNQPSFVRIKNKAEQYGYVNNDDVVKCVEFTIHYIKDIKV